jgi:prophage regulatory protein
MRTCLTNHGPQQVQTNSNPKPQKYLRLPDVESLTGLKKSSIYAGMRATPPTFPHCVRLSARAVAWRESDIAAWQSQREQSGTDSKGGNQ